jgi:hypothetical protein
VKASGASNSVACGGDEPVDQAFDAMVVSRR